VQHLSRRYTEAASPYIDFPEVVSFFLPPPMYSRYGRIISDIARLPRIGLDEAFGIFICQLWSMEPHLMHDVAQWFGARSEDVTRCRDWVLHQWDAWESRWDIDAHALLPDVEEPAAGLPPAGANFERLARQCRYDLALPAFPDGSEYLFSMVERQKRTAAPLHREYVTSLVATVIRRLDNLRLNSLIARDQHTLLSGFYRQHVSGHRRIRELADAALATIEDQLREVTASASEELGALPFSAWVNGIAIRVMLAQLPAHESPETPEAILGQLKPHLDEVLKRAGVVNFALVVGGSGTGGITDARAIGERKVRHALAVARKRMERRILLPAGLKPVASFRDSSLVTAARHGRLDAVRLLGHWYTSNRAVLAYLPKQEPRTISKRGFRPIADLPPYAYAEAVNCYKHLLVRHRNRVFIDEGLWLELRASLDGPFSEPAMLLRFATSQHDYRRLLAAAKSGQLKAQHDPGCRGWLTTREHVEAFRTSR
jgi:hypothetical protein